MGSALQTPRPTPKGWAQIPVSIVENQALLTHGELSLALVVLRRGNGAPVSDRNWENWTGLSPRLKEMAIRGLKDKGLSVEGRGEDARFTWQSDTWAGYISHARQSPSKPRTAGRSVDPKPGAKVHIECRDNGCAMMRAECASGGLNLVTSTPVAKPVSQTSTETGTLQNPQGQPAKNTNQNKLTVIKSTQVAKPVSQTPSDFIKTLAALQAIFPAVGIDFVARLLATVAALFHGVTDSEMAQAVATAWKVSGRRQKSEGLFLMTVPEALAVLRRAPKPERPPDTGQDEMARLLSALDAQEGQCFRRAASKIRAMGPGEPEVLEAYLAAAEDELAGSVVHAGFVDWASVQQRARERVERECPKMGGAQKMEVRFKFERRILMEDLRIPRFSLFA